MMTKLPLFATKPDPKLDQVVRETHDKQKEKQKEYADNRRRVKAKSVKPGDKILVKREKTTIKSPWDPEPYSVVEVRGSKVAARRGEQTKDRAKNHIKVLKPRPQYLQTTNTLWRKKEEEEELGLEVSMEAIMRQVIR